jgi:hypothetical protein
VLPLIYIRNPLECPQCKQSVGDHSRVLITDEHILTVCFNPACPLHQERLRYTRVMLGMRNYKEFCIYRAHYAYVKATVNGS